MVLPPFAVVPFHFELTSSAAFIANGANFADNEGEVAAAVEAYRRLRGRYRGSRSILSRYTVSR